jgi:hypothetical protein
MLDSTALFLRVLGSKTTAERTCNAYSNISGHRPTLTNIVGGLGIKKATGHRPTLTNIVRGLGIQTGEHKSRHRATGQKPIPGMGPGYAMNAANDHGSKIN